jgi:hypothetical protein
VRLTGTQTIQKWQRAKNVLWASTQESKAAHHANHVVLVNTELDVRLVLRAGIDLQMIKLLQHAVAVQQEKPL